jgi:hypothetical protein
MLKLPFLGVALFFRPDNVLNIFNNYYWYIF